MLDFGLAKAVQTGDASEADTIASTREGTILGTPAYMSPEQARGQAVDKRTDIWAFGCVLYELLTGLGAFARGSMTDTLAAVIEREPDWSVLPATTPSAVQRLLRRCLDKDPRHRLRDIGDARVELDASLASDAASTAPGSARYARTNAVLAWSGGRSRRCPGGRLDSLDERYRLFVAGDPNDGGTARKP